MNLTKMKDFALLMYADIMDFFSGKTDDETLPIEYGKNEGMAEMSIVIRPDKKIIESCIRNEDFEILIRYQKTLVSEVLKKVEAIEKYGLDEFDNLTNTIRTELIPDMGAEFHYINMTANEIDSVIKQLAEEHIQVCKIYGSAKRNYKECIAKESRIISAIEIARRKIEELDRFAYMQDKALQKYRAEALMAIDCSDTSIFRSWDEEHIEEYIASLDELCIEVDEIIAEYAEKERFKDDEGLESIINNASKGNENSPKTGRGLIAETLKINGASDSLGAIDFDAIVSGKKKQ